MLERDTREDQQGVNYELTALAYNPCIQACEFGALDGCTVFGSVSRQLISAEIPIGFGQSLLPEKQQIQNAN